MNQGQWQRVPGLYNKREIERLKDPGKDYRLIPRGTDSWGRKVFVLYFRPKEKGGE